MPKYDIKASYKDWSSGKRHTDTQRHSGKNAHEAVEAMEDNLADEYEPEGIENFRVIFIKQVVKRVRKPVTKLSKLLKPKKRH